MSKKLIVFPKYKFLPNLNPQEMLMIGIHGGKTLGKSKSYDIHFNHFKVYPIDIPTSIINIDTLGYTRHEFPNIFYEWYKLFYDGVLSDNDEKMISLHTLVIKWANKDMVECLGKDELKVAKRYGQLLIEMAMNPGFEPEF